MLTKKIQTIFVECWNNKRIEISVSTIDRMCCALFFHSFSLTGNGRTVIMQYTHKYTYTLYIIPLTVVRTRPESNPFLCAFECVHAVEHSCVYARTYMSFWVWCVLSLKFAYFVYASLAANVNIGKLATPMSMYCWIYKFCKQIRQEKKDTIIEERTHNGLNR